MSEWLLQRGKGKTIGPFTTSEIVEGIRSGRIPRDTRVADVAGKSWVELEAEPAFREALDAPVAPSASARSTESSSTIEIASPLATRSARRPLRVAFGAASAGGRARALLAAGALAISAIVDMVLPRTPGGRDLCDAVRPLRDAATLAAAIAGVAAIGVVAGVARDRRGKSAGSALARGAALFALVGAALAGAFAIASARDGVLAVEARRAATFATAAQLALALVALVLAWPVFRVPTRGRALAIGRAFSATALASAALFAIGARFDRAFLDVLYVRDPLDAPAFRDAETLGRWLDAEHDGVARLAAIAPLLASAEPLPCDARVRFVREVPRDGGEPAREVELLDGPGRGARLFVPRRATSPSRHACAGTATLVPR